jgi:hypothetical protein
MIAPEGTRQVAFEQIGGRTVAEFVRWALKDGLLLRHLTGTPQIPIEVRLLGKPNLNLVH